MRGERGKRERGIKRRREGEGEKERGEAERRWRGERMLIVFDPT